MGKVKVLGPSQPLPELAHVPPSTISTSRVGITSSRSQRATSSAGWSLLTTLPVTSCRLSPSKSVRIHLLRTQGLAWQLPPAPGTSPTYIPTAPHIPTALCGSSLEAPFLYLQGLVKAVRLTALGLGRDCSWSSTQHTASSSRGRAKPGKQHWRRGVLEKSPALSTP